MGCRRIWSVLAIAEGETKQANVLSYVLNLSREPGRALYNQNTYLYFPLCVCVCVCCGAMCVCGGGGGGGENGAPAQRPPATPHPHASPPEPLMSVYTVLPCKPQAFPSLALVPSHWGPQTPETLLQSSICFTQKARVSLAATPVISLFLFFFFLSFLRAHKPPRKHM